MLGGERAACSVAASVEAMLAGSARHGTPGGGPRTFGPRQPRILARSRLPWRRAGARAAEAVAAAEAEEAVERRRREEEPAEAAAKREARAEEEVAAAVVVVEAAVEEEVVEEEVVEEVVEEEVVEEEVVEEEVVEEGVVEERRRPSVGAGLRIEHSEAGGTHAASGVGSALISWSGSVVSGQGSGLG